MNKFISPVIALLMVGLFGSFVMADDEQIQEETGTEVNEVEIELETVYYDNGISNDSMAEGFINRAFDPGYPVSYTTYDFESVLTDDEMYFYPELVSHISAIANGEETSTSFTVTGGTYTAADLGLSNLNNRSEVYRELLRNVDSYRVFTVLLDSMPYDMYWCDKTEGYYCTIDFATGGSTTTAKFTFTFYVEEEYQNPSASNPQCSVDPKYGTSVRNAVNNAGQIISMYSGLSDYDKLCSYRDAICDLVEYNHDAVIYDYPYGNPWQMIWVFDGDPSTDVVCEGYSKAFQYLCDNSTFISNDIYVMSAYGTAYFTYNSGGHMWNIVHMDDGLNYLVDITNYDGGAPLFLIGALSGDPEAGYYVDADGGYRYRYVYDQDMKDYYQSSDLALAASDYDPSSQTHSGWEKKNGNWYYYSEDGIMQTGWKKISNIWYYFAEDGVMQTGWQLIDNTWYYFKSSGAMATGWQKVGSKWYYFKSSGAMVTGWKKISNKWYYFTGSGAMKTGWLKLSGKWYYLESSGAMVTGTRTINGKTYNFDSNGVCLNP